MCKSNKYEFYKFKKRLNQINSDDENLIICFPEIQINKDQIEILLSKFYDWNKKDMIEYFKGKIHKSILISSSICTSSEDQPDFQYLFDLGIQALNEGHLLKKNNSD
ncbi:hypothetical protein [Psychroflexus sp. ALD_RP9]|uniref:hypothetical protein n=1 Tax=Psychroflexus sp. ALD_RP9 TaxID=2777186 RepID=UPI001A8E223F|nr:hypothetical protein [Psychroflexus sp. ALD_RP9]QSS96707.1 hypothetical protein IMZ30_09660 [Psychroflexus sp. ALD_RP9]